MKLFKYIRTSSLRRQLNCSKSLRFDYLNKDVNNTSSYAERGSLIHAEAENRFNKNEDMYLENQPEYMENIEDYDNLKYEAINYLNYIQTVVNNANAINVKVEENISLKHLYNSSYFQDKTGISDCVIRNNSTNSLHIIDLKTGAIKVSAKDNYQLYSYAYCIMMNEQDLWDIDNITIHIYQDNVLCYNNTNTIELTKQELISWIKTNVQDKLEAIELGDFKYSPNSYCKYCPNNGNCVAMTNKLLLSASSIDYLSLDEKVELLKLKTVYTSMFSNIENELTEKLIDDEIQHRDLYIGKGRSSRYWSMEDVVEDKLKSIGLDINDFKTESKLLSPAQIEKKLKIYGVKLDLKDLQVKTEPKPKLKFVK